MSRKEKLVLALKTGLNLEEEFIVELAPLCQDCVRASELSEKEKNEIENILSVMQRDSTKHKTVAESLIKKIKMEEKDGHQEDAL